MRQERTRCAGHGWGKQVAAQRKPQRRRAKRPAMAAIASPPVIPYRAGRSVPQDPQALRVALSHVAPAVDPAAGGEKRFAAAEDGTAR